MDFLKLTPSNKAEPKLEYGELVQKRVGGAGRSNNGGKLLNIPQQQQNHKHKGKNPQQDCSWRGADVRNGASRVDGGGGGVGDHGGSIFVR